MPIGVDEYSWNAMICNDLPLHVALHGMPCPQKQIATVKNEQASAEGSTSENGPFMGSRLDPSFSAQVNLVTPER
jgi:hypothetical protein